MNYALWGLFGPVSWPFWLMLLATFALVCGRHSLATKGLVSAGALFVIFALLPTGAFLIRALEDQYEWFAPPLGDIDRILVLAGGEDIFSSARTGQVEFGDHGDRAMAAGLLARRSPSAMLYIAGYGRNQHLPASDTDIAARYWRSIGIASERIIEIERTSDTCGNLSGYAELAVAGPVLLVTSGFHMPRSMACAKAAGVDAIAYPVDAQIGSDIKWRPNVAKNLSLVDLALHEWVGLVWYKLQGRID